MLYSGLVSITFRQLKPREVVDLVKRSGLHGIEWGGDIHVPHGDIKTAKEVCKLTLESGLSTAAYGSYYRVGCENKNFDSFSRVLYTALELKAPTIRVWAGEKASAAADEQYRQNVVDSSRRIAELAEEAGMTVSFEYHGGTLTDTNQSAIDLFNKISHNNIRSFWQPDYSLEFEENLKGIKSLIPLLSNLHVFHWALRGQNDIVRYALLEGQPAWKAYLSAIRDLPGKHYAMLEFVKNDDPEQFIMDALVLKNLITYANE